MEVIIILIIMMMVNLIMMTMMMMMMMMMTILMITMLMMMKGTGTFFSPRELMAPVRVSVEVASPVTRITVVTWGIMMKMLGMKRMMAMMMKQVVTVVREEERREAAEARPQAGQDAVAVPE